MVFSYLKILGMYLKRLFWIITTIPRDIKVLVYYNLQVRWKLYWAAKQDLSVPKIFHTVAQKNREKVAFCFEEESWTFNQVDFLSNQVGNYFSSTGLCKGDVVGLYMKNRVQYVCIWLGLTKIGVIPALINPKSRDIPLQHSVEAAACKAFICGADLQDEICNLKQQEEMSSLPIYVSGAGDNQLRIRGACNLDFAVSSASPSTPREMASVGFRDTFGYIYTSGTTGLPKAARIMHSRFIMLVWGLARLSGVNSTDVVYNPLPLHHTSGGILATGLALLLGMSVVLRESYSASRYFKDCAKYGATVGMYIGEMCRYVLCTSSSSYDQQHKVRMMIGNGLQPGLWKNFRERFNIKFIREFYGSTEGNANMMNTENKVGAVGFISLIVPFVFPMALFRMDDDKKKLLRGEDGLCIKCPPGEVGMLVGKIKKDLVSDFQGYVDEEATEKAIITNVFREGDHAFRTGDLLEMDTQGYLYFGDREGDAFRWKGENVSATEVENVIKKIYSNAEVAVYGVQVPHTEGRAGMAAIVRKSDMPDLDTLLAEMDLVLPRYAIPVFVRFVAKLKYTETEKVIKGDLMREGYNPRSIRDPLYFLEGGATASYVTLTPTLYDKIVQGDIRL